MSGGYLYKLVFYERALQIAAEEYYDANPEDTDILEAGEEVSYRDEFIEKIKEGWIKQAKEVK